MPTDFNKYEALLVDSDKLSFDIFAFSKLVPRAHVLPALVLDAFDSLNLSKLVDETRLLNFATKVQNGYDENVKYHNDLHGADVMQIGHYMIRNCQLHEVLNLNSLDCLSFLIACVAHDLGHDGFTNSYHVNAVTKRAIESNDTSVQETYHAAELFRILSQKEYNFVE